MLVLLTVSALTLLYVYAGYPAILALIGHSRTPPSGWSVDDEWPTVTLLIAAHNEEQVIREKVLNSLAINYPVSRLEIVVAADGCSDRTNDIVREYADRGVVLRATSPRRGKTRALNDALPLATGEIVLLSDANAMYEPEAARRLVRHFQDPGVGAVTGDVRLINDEVSFGTSEGLYYKYERFLMEQESGLGVLVGVDGAMYALRKRLFRPPSGNIILDDFVISMNAAHQGGRLVYDPSALAFEKASPKATQEFKRKVRIVAGGFQALMQREGLPAPGQLSLWWAYLSHKLLRWLTPFALLGVLVPSAVLAPHHPVVAWLLALQVVFYLAAAAGQIDERLLKSRVFNVPNYFCMVQLAALLGFFKGVSGLQSVLWDKAARQ